MVSSDPEDSLLLTAKAWRKRDHLRLRAVLSSEADWDFYRLRSTRLTLNGHSRVTACRRHRIWVNACPRASTASSINRRKTQRRKSTGSAFLKPRLPSQIPPVNAGRKSRARQSVVTLSSPLQPCHASPVTSVIRKKAIIEARPAAAPEGERKKNRITGGPPIPKLPLKRPDAGPGAKGTAGPGSDFRA